MGRISDVPTAAATLTMRSRPGLNRGMYGKQFSFLATSADLTAIDVALQARSDVLLVDFRTSTGELTPVLTSPLPPVDGVFGRVITRLPGPLPVVERHSAVKLGIDFHRSEAIEYWRPFHDGELMRVGRLYYTYGRGTVGPKDAEFCRWADRVMAAVKRMMRYEAKLYTYLAPEAAELIADGKVRVVN